MRIELQRGLLFYFTLVVVIVVAVAVVVRLGLKRRAPEIRVFAIRHFLR